MQLHELKPIEKGKEKKRVGRGGKRGTTSGKGQKGQKSRSGHKIRPATRDLIIRIPKLKGFKNKPIWPKALGINLSTIEKKISDSVITLEALVSAGLVRKSEKFVKILANGEVTKAFTIKGLEVSKTAQEKIEKAGGKVEKIEKTELKAEKVKEAKK